MKDQKIYWSKEFEIGNEIIDNDHKHLFTIYNSLANSISENKGNAHFAEILSAMTDYSLIHFSKEEEYMKLIGYPGINVHKGYHKKYIHKVAMFNSNFLSNNPPSPNEVVTFLKEWWTDHILLKDSHYENFKKKSITDKIIARISEVSSAENQKSGQRFFKEPIKLHGAKTAEVTKIASEEYKNLINTDKPGIFSLAEELFKTGSLEESFVACNWVYRKRKDFSREDFSVFTRWINSYIKNWATCDTFCNHTMGEIFDKFPDLTEDLKKWTLSDNLWVRRASAVSLILPARAGKFKDLIFEICTMLLHDNEDMVQKGYGWLLKVLSDTHQDEVFRFVLSHKEDMPRTSLRYAIEKMPQQLKKKAMEK
jgi:hemerythrin-like metal-binding protein